MLQHAFSRTELLVGRKGIDKLKDSKVMVLGVGGVGSFVVETLVRSGISNIVIVDDDTVCLTNLNRQIHATLDTIGKVKVDVVRERILSINKNCNVITHQVFITKENIEELITDDIDYVVDAIDTVTAKIGIVEYCTKKDIKLISSMGTGNKFDPTQFKISDIYITKVCPLAKVMRHELKKRGIKKLKVLYSEELPTKPNSEDIATCKTGCVCTGGSKNCTKKRQIPGSISFVPPVAGMIIGGEVIKDILEIKK